MYCISEFRLCQKVRSSMYYFTVLYSSAHAVSKVIIYSTVRYASKLEEILLSYNPVGGVGEALHWPIPLRTSWARPHLGTKTSIVCIVAVPLQTYNMFYEQPRGYALHFARLRPVVLDVYFPGICRRTEGSRAKLRFASPSVSKHGTVCTVLYSYPYTVL